jgi:hypothetical protein
MFCTSCGVARADNATVCTNCGERVRRFPPPPNVPNYLIQAVLVTLCCCLPGGVVAIVYAAQVNSKLATGDIPGAQAASRNAKLWCMISGGIGIAAALIYAVVVGMAMMSSK